MRYGLTPVGTMAHSYVLSLPGRAGCVRGVHGGRARQRGHARGHVRHARRRTAMRSTPRARPAFPCKGVRLDSGDLLALSRAARVLLDDAGMPDARIVASGDLDERRIAALVAAGAPIDVWGVGTDLGTSRDSPDRRRRIQARRRSRARRRAGGRSPSARRTRPRFPAPSRCSAARATASWARTSSPWSTSAWTGRLCSRARSASSSMSRSARCAPAPGPSSTLCRPDCAGRTGRWTWPIPSASHHSSALRRLDAALQSHEVAGLVPQRGIT